MLFKLRKNKNKDLSKLNKRKLKNKINHKQKKCNKFKNEYLLKQLYILIN